MKLSDDDFGFSLVSESELKAHEEQLKKVVEQQSAEAQDKLHGLRNMIMPLLLNLSKDPSKEYILWPDRAAKIQTFIKKINSFVDG